MSPDRRQGRPEGEPGLRSVSKTDIITFRLYKAVKEKLRRAARKEGTTFSDFVARNVVEATRAIIDQVGPETMYAELERKAEEEKQRKLAGYRKVLGLEPKQPPQDERGVLTVSSEPLREQTPPTEPGKPTTVNLVTPDGAVAVNVFTQEPGRDDSHDNSPDDSRDGR